MCLMCRIPSRDNLELALYTLQNIKRSFEPNGDSLKMAEPNQPTTDDSN